MKGKEVLEFFLKKRLAFVPSQKPRIVEATAINFITGPRTQPLAAVKASQKMTHETKPETGPNNKKAVITGISERSNFRYGSNGKGTSNPVNVMATARLVNKPIEEITMLRLIAIIISPTYLFVL